MLSLQCGTLSKRACGLASGLLKTAGQVILDATVGRILIQADFLRYRPDSAHLQLAPDTHTWSFAGSTTEVTVRHSAASHHVDECKWRE